MWLSVCVWAKSKSGDDEFYRKQPNSLFAREIVFSHTAVKSIVEITKKSRLIGKKASHFWNINFDLASSGEMVRKRI